jgi:hypothetical protein
LSSTRPLYCDRASRPRENSERSNVNQPDAVLLPNEKALRVVVFWQV